MRSPEPADQSGTHADGSAGRGVVVRHASALIVSTAASAAFGFGFWVAAARWFPPRSVGAAAAVVSAMTLLAGIAQLNLASLYARYVPTAGSHTGRVLAGGATATIAMGLVASALYLWLAPGQQSPTHGWLRGALFGVAVVVSALYFIADGAFTALGRATWVPAKNVVTSAVKLVLVAGLGLGGTAAALSAESLLLAWIIPVTLAVLVVSVLTFGRFVPTHVGQYGHLQEDLNRGEVLRFAGAEYVNAVVSNTVAFAPPVLVSAVVGPASGAFFYIPWIVGVAVTTMLWNIVTPFVAVASGHIGSPRAHLRRAVRLGALVAGGGALVMVAGATPLLALLGGDYARRGAAPMRLIGLSLPFTAVILLFGAFAVMRRRMWGLTAVQATGAVLFFAGAWLGLHRIGLVGPALAYTGSQAAVALVVTPTVLRRYRHFGGPA